MTKLCAACCKPAVMQTRLTLPEGHACTVLPKNGHQEVARCLLHAGANADAADSFGRTRMHCAAKNGHQEVARCLLHARADMDMADVLGI